MTSNQRWMAPGCAENSFETWHVGNRDHLIAEGGTRRMVPWMQFAINPVELHHATKVELQGEVRPEGLPIVIDASKFLPATLQCFTRVRSAGGTTVMVPEIIERI